MEDPEVNKNQWITYFFEERQQVNPPHRSARSQGVILAPGRPVLLLNAPPSVTRRSTFSPARKQSHCPVLHLLEGRKRQGVEVIQGLKKGTGPHVHLFGQAHHGRLNRLTPDAGDLDVAPPLPDEEMADENIF